MNEINEYSKSEFLDKISRIMQSNTEWLFREFDFRINVTKVDNKGPHDKEEQTIQKGKGGMLFESNRCRKSKDPKRISAKYSKADYKSQQYIQIPQKKTTYSCNYDDCIFRSEKKKELVRHKTEVHSRKFECTFDGCDKQYLRKKDLNVHMNVHTKNKLFICQVCKKDFISKFNLNRHEKKCIENMFTDQ